MCDVREENKQTKIIIDVCTDQRDIEKPDRRVYFKQKEDTDDMRSSSRRATREAEFLYTYTLKTSSCHIYSYIFIFLYDSLHRADASEHDSINISVRQDQTLVMWMSSYFT